MAMDFPASPTEGQTYQAPGGPLYTYRAPAWRSGVTQPVIAKTQRNRIVNPALQISQENGNSSTGALTTFTYYAADQWVSAFAGSGGSAATQRAQATMTPGGSPYRLRISMSTADTTLTGTELMYWYQPIEGARNADFLWGTASAKRVIVRFGFRGPAGTYSMNLRNGGAVNRSYIANFTISAGQANTDTEQIILVPGDTGGTWPVDAGLGMYLAVVMAVGPTYVGIAGWQAGNLLGTASNTNGMAVATNVFELFDVGMYLDLDGSGIPPRWEMPEINADFVDCCRYYEKVPFTSVITTTYPGVGYKTEKRTASIAVAVAAGAANGATFGILAYDGAWGVRQVGPASAAADIALACSARY